MVGLMSFFQNQINKKLNIADHISAIDKQFYLIMNELKTFPAPRERYELQLEDPRWKLKAENIRLRDKHKCRLCGVTNTQLDVHHLRYIEGKEAWDYDDGDLVTLCHRCHEKLHASLFFDSLYPGDYFYDKCLDGVGIIERIHGEEIEFNACWTENKHCQEDEHGRLYVYAETFYQNVRAATSHEIAEFWNKVERFYDIDMIVSLFGKHLKKLLPIDHPIRIKARNRFKQALEKYEEQKKFVKEKFDYYLLVSKDNFAALKTNQSFESPFNWPTYEFPQVYFLVAPKLDVIEKPQKDNSKEVAFIDFDFNGYRAATIDETWQWVEYADHLSDLQKDMLPF